ncbi:MipA/OmpV family protein [Endozoicomonas arenosclerae]|uniref:MipA/OmpV family protein n=1 Tax=Endozoicomonas arenosclerae TaxID=1633495 RepID=UPI001561409F|nr:MipA/OmpV family protein [Endozoicomonas arenosclerae]
MSFRHGTIPYANDKADTVRTTIPSIYYEDDYLFLNGTTSGIKLYDDEQWGVRFIGRRRFVNIPRSLQNQYQEDSVDWGFQFLLDSGEGQNWRFELLTESKKRSQLYAGHDWQMNVGNLQLSTELGVRLKSRQYNSYYYGLSGYGGQDLSAGAEVQAGVDFRYPLFGGLNLIGGLEWIYLEPSASKSRALDSNHHGAVRLGFAYFNDSSSTVLPAFQKGSYLRVSHGWATPSDMNQILRGKSESDPYNNQLTSVFYGHPLTQDWLGLPIDVYLTGGLAYHYNSSVQDPAVESVMAIKAYYNFNWPVRWRLGAAEGVSYVSRVTYIEKAEMDKKGNNASKLMNYLDLSVDVNLGDVFGSEAWKSAWLGWSMHHRSSIFKLASQFGRIKGGSNYNTLYLQWDF